VLDSCSRRQALTLVAASCLGAAARGEGQAIDASIRYVVSAHVSANAVDATFTATLWTIDRPGFVPNDRRFFRGHFLSLANHEVRDEFVRMLKAVMAGRARMTIRVDERGKAIESLQLELTV
jgi:hypothetical protein